MKFRRIIGALASMSLSLTAFGSAFATPAIENFHPVVQHEIITDDENSEHALRATARVEVPEGVAVQGETDRCPLVFYSFPTAALASASAISLYLSPECPLTLTKTTSSLSLTES